MISVPPILSLFIISLLFTSISPYLLKSYELFDLESSDSTLFSADVTSWVATGLLGSPKSSSCGGTLLLGGDQIMGRQGWFRRTYSGLPTHKSIRVAMSFYIIDGWSKEDIITIQISNGTVNSINKRMVKLAYTEFAGTAQRCGSSIVKDLYPVYQLILAPHTGSDLTIEIYRTSLSENELAAFGIRDIYILFSSSSSSTVSSFSITDPYTLAYEDRFVCPIGSNPATSACDNCDYSCGACRNSGSSNCYYCKSNYYFDSSDCLPCHSSCATCDGGKNIQCLTCYSGSYMFNNNSCIASCPFPYTSGRIVKGVNHCDFPCDTDEYYYPNGTCGEVVDFPYEPKADGLNWFADYPCNSTQYITPDRVCLNECRFPMTKYEISGIIECIPPCPSSKPYFMVEDAICNATCLPPYVTKEEPSYYKCYRVRDQPRYKIMHSLAIPISMTLLATSVVFPAAPGAIITMIVARMLEYVRYISIDYAKELDQIQATWNLNYISLNLGIKIPHGLYANGEVSEIKELYTTYGTFTLFTINFWNPLLFVIASVGFLAIFYIIELLVKHACWNADGYKWARKIRAAAQNFMLIVFYSSFGNILFFSFLQFIDPSMDTVSGTISFVMTITLIIASLLILLCHVWFLRKQQMMRKNATNKEGKRKIQQFIDNSPGLAVLFKPFKVESVFQQGFFIFYITRELIYMIIVRFFTSYPLIQCLGVLVLCLISLIYFATSVAFNDRWDQVQVYTYETLMIIFTLAAAVVSVMDDNPTQNISTRTFLAQFMTNLFLAFPFVVIAFIVLKYAKMGWDMYKKSQTRGVGISGKFDMNSSPNMGGLSTLPLQMTEMSSIGSPNSSPMGGFKGINHTGNNSSLSPFGGGFKGLNHTKSEVLFGGNDEESFNYGNNDDNSFVISNNGDHSQMDLNPRKMSMGNFRGESRETRDRRRTVNDNNMRDPVVQSKSLRPKRRGRGLSNPAHAPTAIPLNRPRKGTKDESNYNIYNFPVKGLHINKTKTAAWDPNN